MLRLSSGGYGEEEEDEDLLVSGVSGQQEHEHEDLLGLEGADWRGLEHDEQDWLASGQQEHEHEDLLGLEDADWRGLEHIDAEWQF